MRYFLLLMGVLGGQMVFAQSWQLADLQAIPRQGHLPTEPKAWLRFMEANLEWFNQWIAP